MTAAIASAGYTGQLRTDDMPGSHTASTATTAADQHDEHDRARDAELAGLKRKWQVALTTGLS